MASINHERPSRIRTKSSSIIFFEILMMILLFSIMLDSFLDYREGTVSLKDVYFLLGVLSLEFGGIAFIFHYFRYTTIEIDEIDGFSIYSRFSQKNFEWGQVDSIRFILPKQRRYIGPQFGIMALFLQPYLFNTRWVYITLKLIDGKEIHQWANFNLVQMNEIFQFLLNIPHYNVSKTQVDFSKVKGKKYKNPIRDQWLFLSSPFAQEPILQNIFFLDSLGGIRQQEYSKNAKILIGSGSVSLVSLVGMLFLFAGHVTFAENSVVWYILIIIGFVSICIGLIYSFMTPEMKPNPKKNSDQIRDYLIKEFKK